MTNQQLKHWYRFSLRMAHRGWKGLPRKSRRQVASCVKDFFRQLGSFDDPKKPLLPRLRSWDKTDECAECTANRQEAQQTGNWYKLNICNCTPVICDIVGEMIDDWNPYDYNDSGRVAGGYRHQRWDDVWGMRIRCCIRAGMDLASEMSAGVLGFEICDLRRMYRDNIPIWINDGQWVGGKQDHPDLNQGECAVSIWL